MSPSLLVLIRADVIRPSLCWLLRFVPPWRNLAIEMARTCDAAAFAVLAELDFPVDGGELAGPCPALTLQPVVEERGGWQTFGEKMIYDNRWVRLGLVDVGAPNGERWDYHVVHLGRIAVALIVDDRDRVLMLWRYRFVTEQWGFELLGGLVDEGEDAAATATREAEEESGWRPVGEPEHLVSFEPLPGQVTAPVDVFLWRGAEWVGEPTDTEEVGRVEWVALSRVPELVQRRELLGSGTLVALLYYLTSRGGAAW